MSEHGLSQIEAGRRLQAAGPNQLPEDPRDSAALIFLRQFQSPLVYILLAASATIFAIGEIVDGSIILAVLLFNAIVGSVQEGRAQNTLLALKKFITTTATVLRDGQELIIPDTEVVVDDIIILAEGEKVPADARVTLSRNLKVDEAALTGESEPVHKVVDATVLKGTHLVAGNGQALVTATGLETMIGKIAKEIATIDTEIPLKANIKYLSRLIIVVVASASGLLFLVGLLAGESARTMFATIVSLAVSIIPEGLPIVMTLILATGVWRMSQRQVLVKKLQAVEALGQASVIAVDKTGTITKNEMVIQRVYVAGKLFKIGGVGYESEGQVELGGKVVDPANHPELLLAGKIAAFCANGRVMRSKAEGQWRLIGDPTEAAMFVLGQKLGFHKDDLEQEAPLIYDIPFDYKLKYHATIHQLTSQRFLTVVGAPEVVLGRSQKIWHGGKSHPLTEAKKRELETIFTDLSQTGLRVIALAESRDIGETVTPEEIRALTFVGFFGMKDALRAEVAQAMAQTTAAGIRVVMITGDHEVTAEAIAREAGLFHQGDLVLTGQNIDAFSPAELAEKLPLTSIFARVTPEHKLRIIQAYKARGEIVAMTGDGVNDAPSLVAADLGVAMGQIGTEVAKEAADIVLLDDNFGSIVSAVEEGRSIYKTIKKIILYLFSTSVGETLTITGALFLGYPLPILPGQIIWANFVTDGFLDVALAMEPKEPGLLRGNFERPKKYLVDKLMAKRVILMALPMTLGALWLFQSYLAVNLGKALTMSFTVLVVFQWFNAWNCRSEDKSIFQMNPGSNKFLVGATLMVISLQLLAIYHPIMQNLLHTVPLGLRDWLTIIAIASSIILVEEIRKLFYRMKRKYA